MKDLAPKSWNTMPHSLRFANDMYTNSSWLSDLEWMSQNPIQNWSSIPQMDLVKEAADACTALQVPESGRNFHIVLGGESQGQARSRTLSSYPVDVRFDIHESQAGPSRVIVVAFKCSRTWVEWLVTYDHDVVPTETLTVVISAPAYMTL
jgi:hypothetical protein